MRITTRFSLAPVRRGSNAAATHSVLMEARQPTGAILLGTHLTRQFDCDAGFVFVTDYRRPRAEVTIFTLVSREFNVISSRKFGDRWSSWLLSEVRWIDAQHFRVRFHGNATMLFRIRRWGLRGIAPRLAVLRRSL